MFLNFRKAHEQLFELAQLVMAGMSSGNELQKNEALEHLIFLAENKVGTSWDACFTLTKIFFMNIKVSVALGKNLIFDF